MSGSKTHEEVLKSLCLICFNKKNLRNINDNHIELITAYIFSQYPQSRHLLPSKICDACRRSLITQYNPEIAGPSNPETISRPIPCHPDYDVLVNEMITLPPLTRSHISCDCSFCQVWRVTHPKFCQDTLPSLLQSKTTPQRGRPPSMNSIAPRICCGQCFGEIHPGKSHPCTRTSREKNVQSCLSPRIRSSICRSLIEEKMEENPTGYQADFVLSSKGRAKRISVMNTQQKHRLEEEALPIPLETFSEMQSRSNMSNRSVERIALEIRKSHKTEGNLRSMMSRKTSTVADFFTTREINFIEKKEEGEQRCSLIPGIFCTDVQSYIEFLKESRASEDEVLYKFGIDGGGGSIKVTLNIVPIPSSGYSYRKNRVLLNSGVKKLHILALVPIRLEVHENLDEIFKQLSLNQIDFTLASDLKIINLILGLQSFAAKFPCPYCLTTFLYEDEAELRSLGGIKEQVNAFKNSGGDLRNSKYFFNCIKDPLVSGEDFELIIDLIPPPELHLMLGIVNKIFDVLNKRWGDNNAYKWGERYYINRVNYRGGSLEGNQCKRLLSKAQELSEDLPPNLKIFGEALVAFDKVRLACFGHELQPTYLQLIDEFAEIFKSLSIRNFPKAHILFVHVKEFCNKQQSPLGPWSEQASETVHSDFAQMWKYYKVQENHPHYAQRLLHTVVKYNSIHI